MPTGYQIPVLGCAPGVQQQQQQQAQHLAAMAAGIPVTYSGLQGYNFIPYPHHRPIAHMVSCTVFQSLQDELKCSNFTATFIENVRKI